MQGDLNTLPTSPTPSQSGRDNEDELDEMPVDLRDVMSQEVRVSELGGRNLMGTDG